MAEDLVLYWRGPLDACNYGCGYCPFAKRPARQETLQHDRRALDRFVRHIEQHDEWSYTLVFTPWGEALIWPWYQEALVHLGGLPQVRRVGAQSNGSGPSAWTAQARNLVLWLTWHPSEVPLERFAERLRGFQASLAVGVVAQPGRVDEVRRLRAALPAGASLWINALRPGGRYTDEEVAALTELDPNFPLDRAGVRSGGRPCAAGERSLLVEGDGTLRRCHLVQRPVGNLYADDLRAVLRPRPCPRALCDCYVGYTWSAGAGLERNGPDRAARWLQAGG